MAIDPATRASLEIERSQSGGREGSLLAAIDRTVTAAGARLLAARLARPLLDPAAIEARLDAVALVRWSDAHAARRLRARAEGRRRHGPRAVAPGAGPRRPARPRLPAGRPGDGAALVALVGARPDPLAAAAGGDRRGPGGAGPGRHPALAALAATSRRASAPNCRPRPATAALSRAGVRPELDEAAAAARRQPQGGGGPGGAAAGRERRAAEDPPQRRARLFRRDQRRQGRAAAAPAAVRACSSTARPWPTRCASPPSNWPTWTPASPRPPSGPWRMEVEIFEAWRARAREPGRRDPGRGRGPGPAGRGRGPGRMGRGGGRVPARASTARWPSRPRARAIRWWRPPSRGPARPSPPTTARWTAPARPARGWPSSPAPTWPASRPSCARTPCWPSWPRPDASCPRVACGWGWSTGCSAAWAPATTWRAAARPSWPRWWRPPPSSPRPRPARW